MTSMKRLPDVIIRRLTLDEITNSNIASLAASEFGKGNIDLPTLNAIVFDSCDLEKKLTEAKKILQRMKKTIDREKNHVEDEKNGHS